MTRSIFRIVLVCSTLWLGISYSGQSQTYVSSLIAGETRDSITVGSRAGYQISPDPAIVALSSIMNPSIFQWTFASGAVVQKPNGTAATIVAPGFYSDTAISAVMPAVTGTDTLSTVERSQPKAGSSCDGSIQKLILDIMPRATISFTGTTNGACSAQDYNIPVNLSGYGPWIVEYSITYTNQSGVSSPAINYLIGSGADTLGTIANSGPTSLNLTVLGTQLNLGLGTYSVKILNVYDRFGMKSLDLSLVASQAGDKPAGSYDLLIYPAPATSPIKHVKNL